MSIARETALRVLVACRRNGAWADAALREQLRRAALGTADAALCSRIVYGVVQNERLLDWYLGAFCSQRLDRLQPPLLEILRMGAYQILYLDKVPDSAAVNEAVELARGAHRASAAGLVNAVLRNLSRSKSALPALPTEPVERLTIQYSCPAWLVRRLIGILGVEEAERFLAASNSGAPLTVQVNPLRSDAESLAAELRANGVSVTPHGWLPGCLELAGSGDLTTLHPFLTGKLLVQDAAAALVAVVSGAKPGMRVLDVCAAPGGKSFSLAFAMRDEGSILACDLHENKLVRIREGAQRLGLRCIETRAADGRMPDEAQRGQYDLVVCDVPCSGLGILRKKPDVRNKDEASLRALPTIQRAILEASAECVKPGGTLIYSTCTILPEENEAVTDAFLAGNREFSYEPFSLPQPVGDTPGHLTLWPQRHGTDGFYLAKMRRKQHD